MLRAVRHAIGLLIRALRIRYLRSMGVIVGRNVFVSWGAWIDTRRGTVVLGNGAVITNGAKVMSHDFAMHRMGKGASEKTRTVIGADVIVGMNAIVLPGVTIGDHSIVAAGAVVTRDVPSCSMLVGNLGRIIKTLDLDTGDWIKAVR